MKMLKMSLISTFLMSGLFSFMSVAKAELPCNLVEVIGSHMEREIVDQIGRQVAGTSFKINRRKTLVVHGVGDLSFSGCQATLRLHVTLKRKIRRDATGVIKLKAKVSSFDRDEVCLSNVHVADVSLSHTLGIGEGIYKQVANKAIPNRVCYSNTL